MVRLKQFDFLGEHNFLIERTSTCDATTRGVWASYVPPSEGNPGEVMMLYATKESRIYVSHILVALATHSLHKYGEIPIGSPNLSRYSIKIQRRLALIFGQNPAPAVMNSEDWAQSEINVQAMSEISKETISHDLTPTLPDARYIMNDILHWGKTENLSRLRLRSDELSRHICQLTPNLLLP